MTVLEWVDTHFDRVSGHLQAAIDAEPVVTHRLADVREALQEEDAQLWVGQNSAVVTEIKTYPSGVRLLHYWLAGGDLNEILFLTQVIDAYAAQAGCDGVDVKGRRGWAPAIRPFGYEPVGTHYFKRL